MKILIINLIFMLSTTAIDAMMAWLLWTFVSPDHPINYAQSFVICLVFQQLLFTSAIRQDMEKRLR